MAIDRNADYTIRNESGVETEVPGQILIERALANEPDTIDGVPLREFVRQSVDTEDVIQRAHDQHFVDLGPLPDRKERAEKLADIRELEIQAAVGLAASDPEDDNLPDADVTDPKDEDQDGIPDVEEE